MGVLVRLRAEQGAAGNASQWHDTPVLNMHGVVLVVVLVLVPVLIMRLPAALRA